MPIRSPSFLAQASLLCPSPRSQRRTYPSFIKQPAPGRFRIRGCENHRYSGVTPTSYPIQIILYAFHIIIFPGSTRDHPQNIGIELHFSHFRIVLHCSLSSRFTHLHYSILIYNPMLMSGCQHTAFLLSFRSSITVLQVHTKETARRDSFYVAGNCSCRISALMNAVPSKVFIVNTPSSSTA